MKNLPYPDNKHLEAAEGWLELGNWLEANEELEKITPQLRAHPFVLELRYNIYWAAGRWEMAMEVAKGLQKMLPDNSHGYFYTALALHELKRTQAAYDVVIAVVDKFPEHDLMRYNLACYSCQLGNLKEAMQWLEKAIDLASKKDIRLMAHHFCRRNLRQRHCVESGNARDCCCLIWHQLDYLAASDNPHRSWRGR